MLKTYNKPQMYRSRTDSLGLLNVTKSFQTYVFFEMLEHVKPIAMVMHFAKSYQLCRVSACAM
jgi:hypothetical protein